MSANPLEGDRADSEVRWGSGTRNPSNIATTVILDAAMKCYQAYGIKKTNIGDIAKNAKVTRPTIYRYFSSHDRIHEACCRLELERLADSINNDLADQDHFSEYLVQFMRFGIQRLRANSFIMEIPRGKLYEVVFHHDFKVTITSGWVQRLSKDKSARQSPEMLSVTDMLWRWIFSFLDHPSPFYKTDAQQTQLFRMLVYPIFGQALPIASDESAIDWNAEHNA